MRNMGLRKEFTKYVSLNIFGMIGLSANILADTYFVANRLGADGLASLNIAIAVFGLINGLGLMFGIGGATRYSIYNAENKKYEADSTFTLTLLSAAITGILLSLVGLFFSEGLAQLLGADYEILSMCSLYLKIVLIFSPFFIFNHILAAFVRNDGNPKLAMYAMLFGSLSNIVLDYIFMYLFELGILGAALATGFAGVIGICISYFHILTKKNKFSFVYIKIRLKSIIDILSLGISAFINEFSTGIVLIVFNLLILQCAGNTGVAAFGIIANLALVMHAVFMGISNGSQPLISKSYGQQKYNDIKIIYNNARLLSFLFGVFAVFITILFSEELVSVFNSEQNIELQIIAENGLRLYFIGFLFEGINVFTSSLLCSIEQTAVSFKMSFFRGFIGIVAIVFMFAYLFGIMGIWIAFPVVELITVFMSIKYKRKVGVLPNKTAVEI